jgi:tRNA-specific 2-thiouridylase
MSGGVDSSVAALLLAASGRRVEGLFMHNWVEDDRDSPCRADADRRDALAVCARLGLPFHARNFAREYRDGVFTHFLAEYRAGRTPNPDVLCNREIKFKTFLEHALALGAERIATGHYARVDEIDGAFRLLRAVDAAKDQTYFLHAIGQAALARTEFPVGHLPKAELRRMAREAGLPTHDKKDSTGICFIGERDFRQFLARYLPGTPGPIESPDGIIVGEHAGAMYYTLGQREGLGIGGRRGAPEGAWYVVGKDVARNVLVADQGPASTHLLCRNLRAGQLSWIGGSAPAPQLACTARTRHRQPDQRCTVEIEAAMATVHFETPQRAVAPGQSVVFYAGEVCLGGGIIEATDASYGGLA